MNWIWLNEIKDNVYAEFKSAFTFTGGKAELKISADRVYSAFVNGKFASNAQYADVEEHKSFDTVDITGLLTQGENTLTVIAFHCNADFQVARVMPAGIAFEITADGNMIASSGSDTLCRESANYSVGSVVTSQLGYGFDYDFTAKPNEWKPCRLVCNNFNEEPRPIAKCNISAPVYSEVCAQGVYKFCGGETAALKAQNAWLRTLRFSEMTGVYRVGATDLKNPLVFKADGGDGIFVTVDLMRETAGYLALSVEVESECDAVLAWGEHLADLRIRAERAGRNFAMNLKLKAGENTLSDYMLRLGCRYISLFVSSTEVKVKQLALREITYPFRYIERDFGDRLLNKIYSVGARTLELCAHEHYEDCPWREQALYGMDSRNQMLFGYSAFEEYEFPRASLLLLARSVGQDGLLELCSPSRAVITIPSFSLYFIIAVCENAEHDFNAGFISEILPCVENVMQIFINNIGENGLDAFTDPRYWNFHEWSNGLDGGAIFRSEEMEGYSDGLLTALAIITLNKLSALERRLGNTEKADNYAGISNLLAVKLDNYYDEDSGLYASFIKDGKKNGLHAYAQALYVNTGKIPKGRAAVMINELKNGGVAVPLTFAALQMKYDAIMRTDGDLKYIIDEICRVFGGMLFKGATSYWETEFGEADFEDAGSLCHGWSAVACYVFDKYGVK